MSYFNEDQQSWMRTLAKLPPEKKCDCGWSYRGQCFGSCYGRPDKGGALLKSGCGHVVSNGTVFELVCATCKAAELKKQNQ